jgi:hypothetical protein
VAGPLLIALVILHLDNTTATITWDAVGVAEHLVVQVDAIHHKAKTEHLRIINRILHRHNDDPALLMHHLRPLRPLRQR